MSIKSTFRRRILIFSTFKRDEMLKMTLYKPSRSLPIKVYGRCRPLQCCPHHARPLLQSDSAGLEARLGELLVSRAQRSRASSQDRRPGEEDGG